MSHRTEAGRSSSATSSPSRSRPPALWLGGAAAPRPAFLRLGRGNSSSRPASSPSPRLLSLTVLWLSLVALAHLSRRFTDPLSVALLTVLALTAVVVPGLIPGDGLTFAFGASTLVVAALALGLLMRMFDRSLHQRQATAAEAERRRMATDLHDLVAHEVTGIVVLAQAASRAEDPSVRGRARAHRGIGVACPRGDPLPRRLPGRHRRRGTDGTDRADAPGPEALERRLEEFGASDDASTQSGIDLPAPVPTAVWATLDRVLVEALTNVRRHAGPGAHVSMTIASSPDAVALTVESTGGLGGIGRGGGTGLHGLRTRVEDLGGDLTAGPIDGAWRLRARLPLAAALRPAAPSRPAAPRPHMPAPTPPRRRPPMIRVLVVDDQEMVRMGFTLILDADPEMTVVGQAADGVEAIGLAKSEAPDVILLDIRMPRLDGLAALPRLTPLAKVIMVTTFDDEDYVDSALAGGASGFLLKDAGPDLLLAGVRAAAAGDALISPSLTLDLLSRRTGRPLPTTTGSRG